MVRLRHLALALPLTLLVSCGSDDDATTTSSTSQISNVPEGTGEIVASTSLSAALSASPGYQALASTGLVLSTADTSTFTSGDSRAMCENANIVKNIINEIANPDQIKCYMAAMQSAGIIPSIADGNNHYIQLVNMGNDEGGGGNSAPMIKTSMSLNADGTVASFTMHACFGGTAAAPSQSEYISVTTTDGTTTLVSKYSGSESGSSYGSSTTASGRTNSSGQWLDSKTIESSRYFSDGSNSMGMYLSGTQTSSQISYQAYRTGDFGGGSFTDAMYSIVQLIGADALSTFAIGDGSSKVELSFTPTGQSAQTMSSTVSWNGDTLADLGTASEGDFYADADAGSVPSTSTISAVTFDGAEAWDCTVPAGETLVEADFSAGGASLATDMEACEAKSLGYDWIECSGTR